MKRVLVACEESQAVTIELRALGIEAYSCDIEPCSGGHPEWHIQGDVTPILTEKWDMLIGFPPCTYLCSSGMHWTTRGLRDPKLTEDAINFVNLIWNANCDKIAIENPVGKLSTTLGKPSQIIQPWMFGEDASKATCLWLKGLPKLISTEIIPPKGYSLVDKEDSSLDYVYYKDRNTIFAIKEENYIKPVWGNQTPSGQNKLGPSKDRAKLRSKTYKGIAKAMAAQWGAEIIK